MSCHRKNRKKNVQSNLKYIYLYSIRLESVPLAFIQAKLVVRSITLKRFKGVKGWFCFVLFSFKKR